MQTPDTVNLHQKIQYRIIPSTYPVINFFEDLVNPDEMELLWEIESITNERLRHEAGDIFLVRKEDRVSGPGSSIVMAAFTHIGKPSRFTDGSFGIYYASLTLEMAIKETVYNRELFFRATNEDECEIMMRVYKGKIVKPLHDVRHAKYKSLHHVNEYIGSQAFGKQMRENHSFGLIYNSVRDKGGYCIAGLRPPAVSVPTPFMHLRYLWNGKRITEVLNAKPIMKF